MISVTLFATSVHANGVTAGSSSLFDEPDYTDTFTGTDDGGIEGRPYVAAGLPEYRIENNHGNPVTHFTQQAGSAFSIASDAGPGFVQGGAPAYPVDLAPNASGAGSDTGFTQTGGNNLGYGVEYGLRDEYVVQVDAVQVTDRVDITSGDVPIGSFIAASNSISVFFRGDGSGSASVYNGAVDTPIPGIDTGIAAWNDAANGGQSRWYNYAVRFNVPANEIEIFVNEVSLGVIDLNTFADGAYASGFSNQFVSVSTNTGDRTWTDNFQVGGFAIPPVFCDDFERADGPVDNWTVHSGTWDIAGGKLHTTTTGAEHWVWAGDPTVTMPNNVVMEFDMEFLAPGSNPGVGRHAGAMFCSNEATERFVGTSNGYVLWWIDRASDFGLSLARFDGAAFTFLQEGTFDAVAEPPLKYRIEVAGTSIKVFGDDVLYIEATDSTYRGGLFGLWSWAGDQSVNFDNVCITEITSVLQACCETIGATISNSPITFDGSCSTSIGGGDIVRYDWDFGDGNTASGQTVTHTYATGGIYTVTLEVENELGEIATTDKEICVNQVVLEYSEDFNRPDGPVDGWSIAAGDTWRLEGERLVLGPAAVEHWIWAGEKPLYVPGEAEFEFDIEFLAPGENAAVGRHGGFQFHADPATQRGAGWSGYFIDWIDREADRGIRLSRFDNGAANELVRGQGAAAPADPPARWRVVVEGAQIKVFGDDELFIDHTDSTYRGGFFGFWSWVAGQEIAYDNLNVSAEALEPCCEVTPTTPLEGEEVTFDASCSRSFAGDITSYDWDFGDGATASGPVVTHTYTFSDVYTVTLSLTDSAGNSAELVKTVSVAETLEGFRDCFDRADGPLDGWTVHAGNWNIVDETLIAGPATGGGQAGEHQAFAGDPPQLLPANYTIEFDWQFLAPADSQPVGRHAGAFFEFNQPGIRWAGDTSGYQLWWIDRASDRGINLYRWDGAALVALQAGTFDQFPDPPSRMRIEVNGDNIKVFGDGELAVDVNDGTYRGGLFGLWTWDGAGQHVVFDNVRVWDQVEPELCETTEILQGDCNNDGGVDFADVVCIIDQLFGGYVLVGGSGPPCTTTGGNNAILDVNGDGSTDVSDIMFLASYLVGGGPPPSMGTGCISIDPALGCPQNPACP